MIGREALGAYVGGLGPLLGPMLAVLGALGAYVGGLGASWRSWLRLLWAVLASVGGLGAGKAGKAPRTRTFRSPVPVFSID